VILVTLACFLVTLKNRSHQTKTLTRLGLVTLVTLVTLNRRILFERLPHDTKTYLSKKINLTKAMSPTSPMSPEPSKTQKWQRFYSGDVAGDIW
jgi:hypothetical protein